MAPTVPTAASPSSASDGRAPYAPRTLLRDAVVAGAVVAGLYGLFYAVPLPPFAIPGYLMIVAFDALEAVLPSFPSSTAYDAAFATFLAALALLSGLTASWARTRGSLDGWRSGAGSALAVLGTLALVVGVGILQSGNVQVVPVLIVTGTGIALLLGGAAVAFGRTAIARELA